MSGRGRGRRGVASAGTTLNDRFGQLSSAPGESFANRARASRRKNFIERGGNSRFNNIMARRTGVPSKPDTPANGGRGRNPRGGRGSRGRGSRGRGGKNLRGRKPRLNADALDKELDNYMQKNEKFAQT